MDLLDYIRNVPNFPIEGIQFKDVTTLCKVHSSFKESCDRLINHYTNKGINKICAVEARGYIWGGVLSYQLGALIEKAGGVVAGVAFVIELTGSLHGRDKLVGYDTFSLVQIPVEE